MRDEPCELIAGCAAWPAPCAAPGCGLAAAWARRAGRSSLAGRLLVLTGCLLAAVIGDGWIRPAAAARLQEADAVDYPIDAKQFPKGWSFYCADEAVALESIWKLIEEGDPKDASLVCLGKPDGYLRTERMYDNFELTLEWKFPTDENGNSGILLHTVEKDMIWPKAIQVQLHRPTVGSVITHSGAKTDNSLTAKDLSRPVGEWNTCKVTSWQGKLTIVINGVKAGEVTGCMPNRGAIGLQSEGSEIHFRRLSIKPLKSAPEN